MEPASSVRLLLNSGYAFDVDFGSAHQGPLRTDATPPLGAGTGPDSEKLLAAAVANCLAASLVFALRKFKNEVPALRAAATLALHSNEQGRARVQGIDVELHLPGPAEDFRLLERALAQYEDFCVVTQSVRAAIPVEAHVFDSTGRRLTP